MRTIWRLSWSTTLVVSLQAGAGCAKKMRCYEHEIVYNSHTIHYAVCSEEEVPRWKEPKPGNPVIPSDRMKERKR